MFTSFFASKVRLGLLVFIVSGMTLAVFAVARAASGPANTPPGSTLSERVAQRKAEQKIKLDEDDKQRLEFQCTSAQSQLRTMSDGYSSSSDSRDKIYHRIDAALWVVIGKLKLANKDTYNLERQRIGYIKRVKAFENQSKQFQQTIKDMLAMNCKADPVGFKALLETARDYNAQIRSSFISIKSYLIDTVQPTVSKHSDDLKIKTEAP